MEKTMDCATSSQEQCFCFCVRLRSCAIGTSDQLCWWNLNCLRDACFLSLAYARKELTQWQLALLFDCRRHLMFFSQKTQLEFRWSESVGHGETCAQLNLAHISQAIYNVTDNWFQANAAIFGLFQFDSICKFKWHLRYIQNIFKSKMFLFHLGSHWILMQIHICQFEYDGAKSRLAKIISGGSASKKRIGLRAIVIVHMANTQDNNLTLAFALSLSRSLAPL